MQWEREDQRKQLVRLSAKCGEVRIYLDECDDGRTWQYVSFGLGEFSARSVDECRTLWPQEVLAQLRKAIADIESSLSEENLSETNLEGR